MSLHSGIDTYAWVSLGLFTKYDSANEQNVINSLYASLGLIEGAYYLGSGSLIFKILRFLARRRRR